MVVDNILLYVAYLSQLFSEASLLSCNCSQTVEACPSRDIVARSPDLLVILFCCGTGFEPELGMTLNTRSASGFSRSNALTIGRKTRQTMSTKWEGQIFHIQRFFMGEGLDMQFLVCRFTINDNFAET